MKICPNCGAQNADTSSFCMECGSRLPDVDAGIPEPEYEPAGFAQEAASEAPVAENRAPAERTAPAAKLKTIASSALLLVLVIAVTLLVAFAVGKKMAIPAIIRNGVLEILDVAEDYSSDLEDLVEDNVDSINDIVTQIYAEIPEGTDLGDLPSAEEVQDFVENFDSDEFFDGARDLVRGARSSAANMLSRLLSALTSKAWMILVAVALWMIYASAKKEEVPCCSTSGIKILKVLSVLRLVLICIGVFFGLVGILALIFSAGEEMKSLVTGVSVAAIIYLALVVVFRAGIVRTLNRVKSVAEGGELKGRVSGFSAFILCAGGIIHAVFALVPLVLVLLLGPVMLVSLVTALAKAAEYFLEGELIFKCRKELKA